jgi:methylmalonyl-CoA mutase N-terminal domain/subunit
MAELPTTDSGIEIKRLYTAGDLDGWDPDERLGAPGSPPFTRGIYASMYTGRLWTMRQYSGFGNAEATNERFKFLLDAGQTGLSCAFDLPTQMGYDSDHPRAEGEVGKVGVAIDSMADMRLLLADIPLEKVTTSMTINSTAAILLLMYELVAEEHGVAADRLGGTIQNDLLKEYIARGTYVYPPRPSMRIITDIFAYCADHVPNWNTISISGYHIREAGSTAVQEIAFTLANAIAYVQAAVDAGLDVDDFGPRLSFFWNGHNNFFEEVAKFRAARRMWHRIMTERFGARDPKSTMLRFHTQTGGSTLTAQQPMNNVARTTVQAMAAVLGGTQSLHTNGFDEALSLPTEEAARIALRTQQIVAHETGVTDVADPLGGAPFVEWMTDELERQAEAIFAHLLDLGDGSILEGVYEGIESGWFMGEIAESAYRFEREVNAGRRIVVGVNAFTEGNEEGEANLLRIEQATEDLQLKRLDAVKRDRSQEHVDRTLAALTESAADPTVNLMPPIIDAVRAYATEEEIAMAMEKEFGTYVERVVV